MHPQTQINCGKDQQEKKTKTLHQNEDDLFVAEMYTQHSYGRFQKTIAGVPSWVPCSNSASWGQGEYWALSFPSGILGFDLFVGGFSPLCCFEIRAFHNLSPADVL